jgi:hypothetical protein
MQPHGEPLWTLCVSPAGSLPGGNYYGSVGVRPFLILKSSIFKSLEG